MLNVIRRNKKQFLISIGVILGIVLAIVGKHMAHANGLTGEALTGDYLFNKYPIENYMLDSWVDTAGNWMPWNWGDAVDDGIFSILTFLVGSIYVSIFRLFSVIGYFVQVVYSTDLVNPLADMVVAYIQGVSGFNGSFLQNGLFTEFLVTIIIITGVYYGVKILLKESGETINGVILFCVMIAVSLGFFFKADVFIKGANNIAQSIQTAVVGAGTNALGMAGDPGTAIRESFFDVTVYQPYLLLQYNDNTISQEIAEEILCLESGSEEREELVKEQVESGNVMMDGWYGLNLRMSNMLPLVLSGAVLAIVILMMVCINIYHQLAFLLYVCFSPFVLIISLVPGRSQAAVKIVGKIFYELCMRIALAMLLSIMCGFSTAIFSITGTEGYIYGAFLQAVIYVAVFLFRKKLYKFFETSITPKQGGGFRSAVGTFYMANRGFKTLGSILGKNTSRQSNGQSGNATSGSYKPRMNPYYRFSDIEEKPQEQQKEEFSRREKNKSSTPRKGGQQSTRNRTMQRATQAAQTVGSGNVAGAVLRIGMEKNQQKKQNRQNLQNRNGSNSGSNSYSVNVGKYRTARKETVPRIRQAQWKKQTHQAQGDVSSLERRQKSGNMEGKQGSSKRDNKTGQEYTVRQKTQSGGNSSSQRMNQTDKQNSGNVQGSKNNSYGRSDTSAKYTVRNKKNMVSRKKDEK